jgi:hypothetical protein
MKTGGLDRGWIILKEYCYLEANLVGYSIDRATQFSRLTILETEGGLGRGGDDTEYPIVNPTVRSAGGTRGRRVALQIC